LLIPIRNFIQDEASGTSTGAYLVGLTGMRGLAAILVMLFHLFSMIGRPPLIINIFGYQLEFTYIASTGWVGVNLFFVLSGFLLGLPFVDWLRGINTRPSMANFYKRRFLRIFPAFYAQLLIFFILGLFGWYRVPQDFYVWILHAFMLHNLSQPLSSAINGVYWTLPVEFGFYLLLPWFAIILFCLRPNPKKLFFWFALLLLVFLLVAIYRYSVFHFITERTRPRLVWALGQLPGVFDQFLCGFFAAFIYRHFNLGRNSKQLNLLSNLLFLIGMCGTLAMMYIIHSNVGVYWRAGYGLLFYWNSTTAIFIGIWVIAVAMRGSFSRKSFETTPVIFLGLISYSLYLWHSPVLQKLKFYLARQSDIDTLIWLIIVGSLLVIAISTISYIVIERPFLNSTLAILTF